MADNIRGTHVSPGIYTKETDITYAVKSLGLTTLGVVGETLKGPAFQPMLIQNWREFQDVFGGTSAEKFIGSQYPKYELPYIAKSYLKESNQLQVCRVLGLSGYNAGPAWAITGSDGSKNGKKTVIAILRSRGHYEEYSRFASAENVCNCPSQQYDKLIFDVGEILRTSDFDCNEPVSYNMGALQLSAYTEFLATGSYCDGNTNSGKEIDFSVNPINYGKFKIVGLTGAQEINTSISTDKNGYFEYSVSLNPSDKDYILKVLGTTPFDGEAPIYVEALYDVALKKAIESAKITQIDKTLEQYNVYNVADYCALEPINDFVNLRENALTRKHIGTRWIADKQACDEQITCHAFDYETNKLISTESEQMVVGQIYTVKQVTDEQGKRHYYYGYYKKDTIPSNLSLNEIINALDQVQDETRYKVGSVSNINEIDGTVENHILIVNNDSKVINHSIDLQNAVEKTTYRSALVKNNYDDRYYRVVSGDVEPVTCDLNNYKDTYRYASTPWFVSNIKGDATHYELNKLFRFHTITDGNNANNEVKISIQNIKPDAKTFDVLIRKIDDTDESVIVLEKYLNCTLTPGDPTYIAYKIGSFDGIYEVKSKYVTVEVNENIITQNSVPAGFMGYPLGKFNGTQPHGEDTHSDIVTPELFYRTNYDQNIKHRRQYFGLSNSIGVDIDSFTYKGKAAYMDYPDFLCKGFHLDSRLDIDNYEQGKKPKITVDGVEGYKFDVVPTTERTKLLQETPIIASESDMVGSIYENVDLRKFTAYFYGGFDGWDIYRDARSNTDEFKINKYQGNYNESNGEGYSFDKIQEGETIGLNQPAITSDWYAYLAAARQFANPEAVDINVFATPGIDIVNNTELINEIIEMIEEERADSIYVATMPDKPFGATDYVEDMYTPSDAVYELENTDIDSNYTCTYYPWVKYHDTVNNQFIFLPPTKDVVRNMAMTDNKTHPWFAPAGISRGDVDCVKAKIVTKIDDEDNLYEGRINPVKTFASDGVKIWGQKNLQIKESLLNRIAVRRLLLRLRKLISISCIGLIFDPNDPSTRNKFLSTVTPIMDNIKSNRGISDYRIEVEDTPESRDRRELNCKLYFKPYNALEYINLEFVVTPESVSFDSI